VSPPQAARLPPRLPGHQRLPLGKPLGRRGSPPLPRALAASGGGASGARLMTSRALDIAVVGGGPAGLYFAVLAKRANPAHRIRLSERNRAGDTFGFGVVFSENTMGFLTEQDRQSYPAIMAGSRRWDPISGLPPGGGGRCGGVGFSSARGHTLRSILP